MSKQNNNSDPAHFGLSDEFIAQIAKLLQMAMLTGTNIGDNLRLVQVMSNEDGKIVLTPEYKEYFEASIKQMLAEAEDIAATMQKTVAQA